MNDESVIDTSVLAKFYFDEIGSDATRQWIRRGPSLLAPRHILTEIASVGLKKIKTGLATADVANAAVERAARLVSELAATEPLLAKAIEAGQTYRISLYDGLFAALALERGLPLVTADDRLRDRLVEGGYTSPVLAPADLI